MLRMLTYALLGLLTIIAAFPLVDLRFGQAQGSYAVFQLGEWAKSSKELVLVASAAQSTTRVGPTGTISAPPGVYFISAQVTVTNAGQSAFSVGASSFILLDSNNYRYGGQSSSSDSVLNPGFSFGAIIYYSVPNTVYGLKLCYQMQDRSLAAWNLPFGAASPTPAPIPTPKATLTPSGLANSPWPMFQHDIRHTGRSPYIGTQDPQLKWTYSTTGYSQLSVISSPVVGSDGTIYIGSGTGKLLALNSDGSLKWSFLTGNAIRSTPAIGSDETIYIGSEDGYLYAVNHNGSLKWKYNIGTAVDTPPTIAPDGTIYIGSWSNNFYAINPDGTLKWIYTASSYIGSPPAIGADGTIYTGSYDKKLHAINPDGSKKWVYTTGATAAAGPSIGDDGTIYIGSDDHKLYAINPNGSLKWAYLTGHTIGGSPAIGSDGTVYIGSNDDKIYAINPDGTLQWTFTTGADTWGGPIIGTDGTIYAGSRDKKLYAINPDGSLKWSYTTNSDICSSIAIDADGTVYVASYNDNLYAIGSTEATPTPTPTPTLKPSFTGSQTVMWYKTFGGTGGERAECVQQTSDGGFVLVGHTTSFGAGESDVWLIKTDSNGNKLWDRTFGGKSTEGANFVQQAADGGYIMIGSTNSFGAGCSDIWLIRTNANGEKLWDKTFGSVNCDYGYCVRQTADGGFALVGELASSPTAYADLCLIKTDSDGNRLWEKTFGAGVAYSFQQTSDGGFIMVAGGRLIKTDSNGEKLWENEYELSNGFSVQQTSDGGFIITGVKSVDSGGAYQYDALLLKTDAYGNVTWGKVFGSLAGEDRGQSVQQTSDGGYIIGGITNSYGAGEYDVWIIRTDSDGNKLWDSTFGGSQADEAYSVLQTADGDYVLAGSTLSYGAGYYDVWLLKASDLTPPKNMWIYVGGPALGFVFLALTSWALILRIRRQRLAKQRIENQKAEIIDMIDRALKGK